VLKLATAGWSKGLAADRVLKCVEGDEPHLVFTGLVVSPR
jgi:hypothetical protein